MQMFFQSMCQNSSTAKLKDCGSLCARWFI